MEHSKTNTHFQRYSLPGIFLQWLSIGIQSFGGGSATFFLIHQTCLKHGWLTDEEFLNAWAIAQLTPGINLIKITIFIGKRQRGWKGVIAATSGLLIPSAVVTGLMTFGYAFIQAMPAVKAIMRGILPATIGMALAMTIRMASPVMKIASYEGKLRFIIHILIFGTAAFMLAINLISPAVILILTGIVASLVFRTIHIPSPEETAQ